MAIYCPKHRLLFIMTPRTACTAVGQLLLEELGGEYLPSENLWDRQGRHLLDRKHCTLEQMELHNVLNEVVLEDLFVFTTVGNHFDSF